ncbi:MAG: hypothetical protein H6994_03990 [Pseudomonadales bacterium]|nr:hypothetical protein [Pseudomonadales bacterium]
MKIAAIASICTLIAVSGNAMASPCGDALKQCLDENRAWYEACTQRARKLADDPRAGANYNELRALCAQMRTSFDDICRNTASECSRKRVDELKKLSGE